MWSLALFPCSYTDGARIIGELSNSLRLPVYTDAMLFSDISEQFGVPVEKITEVIYEKQPLLRRHILRKKKYINLLRFSLDARRMLHPGRCLFYGLHTSLFDHHADRVLKVLIFDNKNSRTRRAVKQEGFTKENAWKYIADYDEHVSGWTQFLFHKHAYERSLYDAVIDFGTKDFLDVTRQVVSLNRDFAGYRTPLHADRRPVIRSRGPCQQPVHRWNTFP